MKKIAIMIAMVLALGAASAHARVTAKDAFLSAPSDVFMLLDRDNRLDMIDYFTSGQSTPVSNMMSGQSRISSLTDQMITIEATPSSVYTLAILPGATSDDDVIALIVTLSTPAKDSRVQFYRAGDWQPLDAAKILAEPTLKEWLTPEGRKNQDLVEAVVPFIMAEYSYDPASRTLTISNDLQTFLSADMYQMIQSYLKPTISYGWTGKKFTLKD